MDDDPESGSWRVETDHQAIRELAADRDATPTRVDGSRRDVPVAIEAESGDTDGTPITWPEFFEVFESEGLLVRVRRRESEDRDASDLEVVERRDASEGGRGGERPDDEERPERLAPRGDDSGGEGDPERPAPATGDTGDAEPVVYEDDSPERSAERGRDRDEEPETPSTAPLADAEHGPTPTTDALVVDEIHPSVHVVGEGLEEEHLVFLNAGEETIDLSGWRVRNREGRSYEFPSGTDLDPGERLVLHSGEGEGGDADDRGHHHHHHYWGADESVWGSEDVIVVETGTGERVVRERFEA